MSGPEPGRPPCVRVRGLFHRYGGRPALDGITLDLDPGTLLGVIGPDGVGKSTLLGLVAGERRIQEGSVEVLGADMRRARARRGVAGRIAFLPQGLGSNLYGDLTIAGNVTFFARLFDVPRREAAARGRELLEATGLRPFTRRLVRNLSGGMKQKLGLCCALIHRPDLLVLDEPTTGVDPLSRRAFWELLREIRSQTPDLGVVVATAYMEEAEAFDRLVMLDAGRVLAAGTPEKLKQRSGHDTLEGTYAAFMSGGAVEAAAGRAAAEGEGSRPGAAARAPAGPGAADRDLHAPTRAPGEAAGAPAPPARGAASTPGGVAIRARDLTRRFGSFTAVDAVTFEVRRGEIFGFVGPNGSGKTTTMKMVTGILPPSAGEAFLLGDPVQAGVLRQRRRVGYMSQGFSLYPDLSARENLVLYARLFDIARAERRRRIRRLAGELGLTDQLDRRAEDLPLGHRQRLALAVATIHGPDVLVLDEPTSGVDPVARNAFWRLLEELAHERGTTLFVSTHYLAEAARCDRIALMNAGRLLAVDVPEALAAARGAADLEDAFVQLVRADDAQRAPGAAA